MGDTVHIRGTGGARYVVDVPDDVQGLERFVQRVLSGDITVLDGPDADADIVDRVAFAASLMPSEDADGNAVEADPLAGMTVKQLRAFADANGIELGEASKKAEVLEVIHDELERRDAEA